MPDGEMRATCAVKLQATPCEVSQFLPSCDKKRGVLRVDHGTDAVQVRRSAPAEATRTENALGVRCS